MVFIEEFLWNVAAVYPILTDGGKGRHVAIRVRVFEISSPFLPGFTKYRLRGATDPRKGNHLRHASPDLLFAVFLRV